MVKDFAHGMIIMKIFRQHWRFKLQTVAIRFIINAENSDRIFCVDNYPGKTYVFQMSLNICPDKNLLLC